MKKIILSLFVVALAAGAQAQETPSKKTDASHHYDGKRGHHGKHRGGMDLQSLNLTEDQKAQFKTQHESMRKQMEQLKSESLTSEQRRQRMETIRKENKAKVDGILTTDQKAQLQKQRAEAREKQKEMGKEREEKMKSQLGLTDDQSAKLQANRKEMGDKMKAIRENKSLSDEQKKEQFKELMKSQKDKMKSILTEEQLNKMKEMHHRKPGGDRKKEEIKPSSL